MQPDHRIIQGSLVASGGEAEPDVARLIEELWERHSLSIFLFARGRLSNREDARDVCQETFVRAMRSARRNGCPSPTDPRLGAWLKRIATNIMIDRYRSPQTRMGMGVGGEVGESGPALDGMPSLGSQPSGEPSDTAAQVAALRSCLDRLGERKRELVELRALREYDYPAIEIQLGVSTASARVMYFRALRDLRECMEARTARGVVGAHA